MMVLIVLLSIVKIHVTIVSVVLVPRVLLGAMMTVVVLVVLEVIISSTGSTSTASPTKVAPRPATSTMTTAATVLIIVHLSLMLIIQHFFARSFRQYWLITAVRTIPVALTVILATGGFKLSLKVARPVPTGPTSVLVKRGMLPL